MKKTLVLLLALLLFVLPLSGALASVSLPAGLKAIEAEAFEGDSAFTGVVELPGGIRSGYNAIFMMAWYVLSLFACLGMRNTYEKTMDFKPTVLNAMSTVILILYCVLSLSGVSVFLYFNF